MITWEKKSHLVTLKSTVILLRSNETSRYPTQVILLKGVRHVFFYVWKIPTCIPLNFDFSVSIDTLQEYKDIKVDMKWKFLIFDMKL